MRLVKQNRMEVFAIRVVQVALLIVQLCCAFASVALALSVRKEIRERENRRRAEALRENETKDEPDDGDPEADA